MPTTSKRSLSRFIPLDTIAISPLRVMSRAGLILLAGILIGIFVPGCLYWALGTFQDEDIANRLPKNERNKWAAYIRTEDALQASLDEIDRQIADTAENTTAKASAFWNDMSVMVDQRRKLKTALEELKAAPPFHLSGFYLNTLMLVWPAFYIALAWLVVILAPNYPRRPGVRRWIPLFIGALVLYRWPTWMRNIPPLRYIERQVYGNGNWDISVGSFFVQELQAFIACLLLVAVWAIWIDFIPVWQDEVREHLLSDGTENCLAEFAEGFVKLFLHWQVCSVVLAGAFLPYTFYFWDFVIGYRDRRYWAHAVIMHGLWGITWLLISIPLAWTWYQWNVYKLRNYGEGKPTEPINRPDQIEMGALIGSWNVMGSLAGAVIAFGFPVIKEIVTHL